MMDIYTRPGSRVKFTGCGGYDNENARAKTTLEVGGIYTVVQIQVSSWTTLVYLEGHKHPFNTVMFENIDGLQEAAEMAHNKGESK